MMKFSYVLFTEPSMLNSLELAELDKNLESKVITDALVYFMNKITS